MPRYGRYLRLEKNIAASDTGGILERWRYGRTLLTDPVRVTPNSNLKNGVLAELIGEAKGIGVTISRSEIQYRMQAARVYESEAQLSKILGQFENWWGLIQAGFPPVETDSDDEPYDPHAAGGKQPKPLTQEPLTTSDGKPVPAFDPPVRFGGDEHGPRSTIEDLYAACKESEGYTERMAANDARRRGHVDDLADAVGGDLTKTWYEAEVLRRGLDAFGVSDLDSFNEIMGEFFRLYDDGQVAGPGTEDDQ